MRINSKNMFKSIVTTEKRLNAIEKRIFFKEQRLLQSQQNSINFMKFFDSGYQKGIDEGEKTGFKVGYKPAGGISKAKDALVYLSLIKEELGNDWMDASLFRFGASSLLGDIERQLEHYLTGNYSANYRHPLG